MKDGQRITFHGESNQVNWDDTHKEVHEKVRI